MYDDNVKFKMELVWNSVGSKLIDEFGRFMGVVVNVRAKYGVDLQVTLDDGALVDITPDNVLKFTVQ